MQPDAGVAAVLARPDAFADPPGLSDSQRTAWRSALGDGTLVRRLDLERATLARLGATFLTPADPDWPVALPPGALRLRGALPVGPAVAVVGARGADPYGLEIAERLAAAAAARGVAVVSGGAFGVDAAAHRAALEAGGRTVVVLGSGLAHPSPSAHAGLFERAAARGAVASPFPSNQPPAMWTFPRRNSWIARLAQRVVVVQASRKSGALYTARAALAAGIPVWAVPGPLDSPLHEGCHALIELGARVVTAVEACLPGEPRPAATVAAPAGPSGPGHALWQAAGAEPRPLAALADAAGLSMTEAAPLATLLELDGWLRAAPGGRYARSTPKVLAQETT